MKSLLTMIIAAGLLAGTLFTSDAEAGGRKKGPKPRRAEVVYQYRDAGYFRGRDIAVIRAYYRPHRWLPPGLRRQYARTGHLPPGWAKRMRPIPVYIERNLVVLPREYRRGLIDGNAVVYSPSGVIIDVAMVF